MGGAGGRGQVGETAAAAGCSGAIGVCQHRSGLVVVEVLCMSTCICCHRLLAWVLEVGIVVQWSTVHGVCAGCPHSGGGRWHVRVRELIV